MSHRTEEKQRLIRKISQLERRNADLRRELDSRHQMNARRSQQLRALAAELLEAEQNEHKRLAAHLHDNLQQLLVLVKLRLETLQEKIAEDDQGSLSEACEHLGQAIQASRDFAMRLSPPLLDEAGLSAALVWLAETFERQQGLKVRVDLAPGAEPANEAVRRYLFRAVNELLFNVVKHADVDHASLAMQRVDAGVEITVEDEGRGMNSDALLRQVGSSGGMGLRKIAERLEVLGGRMSVESQPGRGTRIRLSAPVQEPQTETLEEGITLEDGSRVVVDTERGSAALYESDAPEKIRVLLVDDHEMFREGITELLTPLPDVEVVAEAANGQMAVELARSVRPDVIVMDLDMPFMGGIEATRRILREDPQIRIIVLSMHDGPEVRARARAAGAADVVAKEEHSTRLVERIRKTVALEAGAGSEASEPGIPGPTG